MKRIMIVAVILVIAGFAAYVYLIRDINHASDGVAHIQIQTPATTTTTTTNLVSVTSPAAESSSSTIESASQHPGMKLYRNDEYGFEFWYPEGWEVKENTYGNPETRFNVVARPIDQNGKHPFPEPLTVAVVTPDLVKKQYSDLASSAQAAFVNGKKGLRYQYVAETQYDDIIISLDSNNSIIIDSAGDTYATNVQNILSSFQFLK